MKRKCDQCGRPATHHAVEIVKGEKIETHLCDTHAAESGLHQAPAGHKPLDELLTSFVKVHSTGQTQTVGKPSNKACSDCGLSFAEFREKSLLGCPTCYADFEGQLGGLLERAHEGGTHHVGKTPRRAGGAEQRQLRLARLQRRLDEALEAEAYEEAAEIRDELEGVAAAADQPGGRSSGGASGGGAESNPQAGSPSRKENP